MPDRKYKKRAMEFLTIDSDSDSDNAGATFQSSDDDSSDSSDEESDLFSLSSEEGALSDKHLFVAAIDFGTAYSGYAFSSRSNIEKDPLKVNLNTWAGSSLLSQKTPTCILFDPKKKFHSFGFEAEDKYSDLASDPDEDHKKWYFFRRFKMSLFDKMKLKRDFILEDEIGNKMPALDVFSASIRFLKENMEAHCRNQNPDASPSDIRWVLTVPAIWNESCKQFMREAAEKAGIDDDSLVLALEPEAASMCCKHLPIETFTGCGKDFAPFQRGAKYMVLDAGGGTVDITVHEVLEDDSLSELYNANGGNWGGTYVDLAFRNFLADIVGNDIMDDFAKNNTADYIELFRDFEIKKRTFKNATDGKILIKVPIALTEKFETFKRKKIMEHLASNQKYKNKVSWIVDKLRIDPLTAKGIFHDACKSTVQHVRSLFDDKMVENVSTILMVGGFSESRMLQDYIREEFGDKRIIIPADAGIAVLKGAVIYGHKPSVIKQRRCRYTYGVETSLPFRNGIDPQDKIFIDGSGKKLCIKRFNAHVKIGQCVTVGKCQKKQSYTPTTDDQESFDFLFFATRKSSPTFTDEDGCLNIGKMSVDIEGFGLDRSVSVKMMFSGTELTAEAVERDTGKRVKCALDFLG